MFATLGAVLPGAQRVQPLLYSLSPLMPPGTHLLTAF